MAFQIVSKEMLCNNQTFSTVGEFFQYVINISIISDCGATREFNSITGSVQGRRRRRSTEYAEYSYPKDRPLTDLQNSVQHSLNIEPGDKSVVRNISNVENHAVRRSRVRRQKHVTPSRDHHHHIDSIGVSGNTTDAINEKMHSMMDVMDTRIEGVEGVMSELQKTVHKLNKKVRFITLSSQLCASFLVYI